MFPVVGSALSKTSRRLNRARAATRSHGSVESIVPGSGERTRCRGFGTLPSTRRTALCDRRIAITRNKGERVGPERNTDDDRSNIARARSTIAISSSLAIVRSAFDADSLARSRSFRERERERERERRRWHTQRGKFGTRAFVAARKLKAINHACVSHRRPMNINENHCAVYGPINPGVKIFRLWWCFIGRCSTTPLSRTAGRPGERHY